MGAGFQKLDLERQTVRLAKWAAQGGHRVVRVGSGMNGGRSKARRLLADPDVTTMVVEHKDRLGRMNVELAEAALSATGRRLVVLDNGEVEDDLVRDMLEIPTVPGVAGELVLIAPTGGTTCGD